MQGSNKCIRMLTIFIIIAHQSNTYLLNNKRRTIRNKSKYDVNQWIVALLCAARKANILDCTNRK